MAMTVPVVQEEDREKKISRTRRRWKLLVAGKTGLERIKRIRRKEQTKRIEAIEKGAKGKRKDDILFPRSRYNLTFRIEIVVLLVSYRILAHMENCLN